MAGGLWGSLEDLYQELFGGGTKLPSQAGNIPGSPGYDPRVLPAYTAPTAEELELLRQYGAFRGIFGDAYGRAQAALETPSAIQTIMPWLRNLGAFIGRGGQAAEAYRKAAMQDLYQTGQEALRQINMGAGGRGILGSTIHGVSQADLLARALANMANIRAQEAAMAEQSKMQRLGLGMQGLAQLGSMIAQDRYQDLIASQQLAELARQADQQRLQQIVGYLAMMGQLRQEPWQAGMEMYRAKLAEPPTPTFAETLMGIAGMALPLISYFSPPKTSGTATAK